MDLDELLVFDAKTINLCGMVLNGYILCKITILYMRKDRQKRSKTFFSSFDDVNCHKKCLHDVISRSSTKKILKDTLRTTMDKSK